jgi:hypothetical protein
MEEQKRADVKLFNAVFNILANDVTYKINHTYIEFIMQLKLLCNYNYCKFYYLI